MMAPMGNGDLGHHPEKMLPPPEAPDIQVNFVNPVKCTMLTPCFSDFPHKQQGTGGWRSRRKPLWRLEALCLWGGTVWMSILFCPMLKLLLFRAMATLGALYLHWIPAQMMPTLSLNTSTTLGLGMQWYSWLFSRPSSFNFWDLGVSTFASFHFQSQQVQETCRHVRPGVWLRRVWGLLCSIMKPPIQTKLQWNNF